MSFSTTATAAAVARFDSRLVTAFCDRSRSESTRRNYRQVIEEFFDYMNHSHPALLSSTDVSQWRDRLVEAGKRPATVTLKLAVIRSFYEYLKIGGIVVTNPAAAELVRPPKAQSTKQRRTLSSRDIFNLLAGPDRNSAEGARDYALLQIIWKLSLRLDEVSALRVSSIFRNEPTWALMINARNGRNRIITLPDDIKSAIDNYLILDEERRRRPGVRSNGQDAFLFQPICNYRTLEFNRPLTTRMIRYIVKRWTEYAGLEHASPRDARRTFIVSALERGLSCSEIKALGGWKSSKTLARYRSENCQADASR
ncbi:MAG TPA: tyrosine-type recombinase/integrase [Blastocatellia bacterium]|nr:tyrosine-type recombinase/integrase [Blastocatellia bacterium]